MKESNLPRNVEQKVSFVCKKSILDSTPFRLSFFSALNKLSEESLTRQPEEVFDIMCKLGEGSYGSVYKAVHKESGQVLAIKQVPVDTDLQEIIKEISIMQQCDSLYVVKYYGSYFKNTDLWVRKLTLKNISYLCFCKKNDDGLSKVKIFQFFFMGID